jgi:hypothetical protein
MRNRLALAGAAALATILGSLALAQPAMAAGAQAASTATGSRQPWPVTITIRTVPPLAGVRFTFDGQPLVTGPGGTVSHTERHNFSKHALSLADTRIKTPSRHYRFARWAGQRDPNQAFLPTVRGLPMRASYTVTAAFGVRCPVTPYFTDQKGFPLDPLRITAATLRSDSGRPARLDPTKTSWLRCGRAAYRGNTMASRNVRYSVQSVMFGGTNIVHAGIERFSPRRNPNPTIVGYFHNLTIAAHDALFGGGTGTVAVVTMPDHTQRRVSLGPGHAVTLRNLPQGTYRVDVKAGNSIISAQSLRLSKDESVNLTAVSRGDLATIGGTVLFIAAGLPLMSGTRRKRVLGLVRRWLHHGGRAETASP